MYELILVAVLVAVLVSLSRVKARVQTLERDLAALRTQPAASTAQVRHAVASTAPVATALGDAASSPSDQDASSVPVTPTSTATPALTRPPAAPPPLAPAPVGPKAPVRPNPIDLGVRAIKRWFTVGNVPVKIGMLVLLAGVAALLKYASDQGWLRLPIELRLAGIALAALAGLVFAWRQRTTKPAFSLAVQGGAIGVLLLTVFAAFKLYGFLGAGAAFALSVVLVAGLGVLAVLQDARTLAVLGILAGFLAPIWLSSGSGNYVALFSYYALLNAAILAIAWMRSWRVLNLLGFAFTWGIGIVWGVLDYSPEKYAGTQPFLVLFFLFYLALPILYARRRPARARDRIDGCLLFGTPLIAFSLQAALLEGARMPLAFCALGLAALYALLARALIGRERYAVLGQGHALLAVGFATLAIPLAFSAHATAGAFALEGAGLVWLGLKQARRVPRWIGLALQLAAAVAFAIGASDDAAPRLAVANAAFMGGLLIALAGFASAWAYRAGTGAALPEAPRLTLAYYIWGQLWWCGIWGNEIDRADLVVGGVDYTFHAWLVLAAVSGWLAAELHRRRPATALSTTTLAGFGLAVPLAMLQTETNGQPLAGIGVVAWLAFAALGVRSLLCLRDGGGRMAAGAQFVWWLVWPALLSLLAQHIAHRFDLASGWTYAMMALPWLAIAAVSLKRWNWLSAPLGAAFDAYRPTFQVVLFGVLGLWWISTLSESAGATPLPWVAVLNPVELGQLAVLALIAAWLWSPQVPEGIARWRTGLLAAAGFAYVTVVTVRAVHHWAGVPWDPMLVSAGQTQTALTVVWSVLGVIGWVVGSRRGHRMLWLASAVLMGVVLAKLVLVDRQHLGNLLGIGSFIAYGLLCTVVGWLAPAPPSASSTATAEPEGSAA